MEDRWKHQWVQQSNAHNSRNIASKTVIFAPAESGRDALSNDVSIVHFKIFGILGVRAVGNFNLHGLVGYRSNRRRPINAMDTERSHYTLPVAILRCVPPETVFTIASHYPFKRRWVIHQIEALVKRDRVQVLLFRSGVYVEISPLTYHALTVHRPFKRQPIPTSDAPKWSARWELSNEYSFVGVTV